MSLPGHKFRFAGGGTCTIQDPQHPNADPLDLSFSSRLRQVHITYSDGPKCEYTLISEIQKGIPIGPFTIVKRKWLTQRPPRKSVQRRSAGGGVNSSSSVGRSGAGGSASSEISRIWAVSGTWERNLIHDDRLQSVDRGSLRLGALSAVSFRPPRVRKRNRFLASVSPEAISMSVRPRRRRKRRFREEELRAYGSLDGGNAQLHRKYVSPTVRAMHNEMRGVILSSLGGQRRQKYHPALHGGLLVECSIVESLRRDPRSPCGQGAILGLSAGPRSHAGTRSSCASRKENHYTGEVRFTPSARGVGVMVEPTGADRALRPLPFCKFVESNFVRWGYGELHRRVVPEFDYENFYPHRDVPLTFSFPSDVTLVLLEFTRGTFRRNVCDGVGIQADYRKGFLYAGQISLGALGQVTGRNQAVVAKDGASATAVPPSRFHKRRRIKRSRSVSSSGSASESASASASGLADTGLDETSPDSLSRSYETDLINSGVMRRSDGCLLIGKWEKGYRKGISRMIAPCGSTLSADWTLVEEPLLVEGAGGAEPRSEKRVVQTPGTCARCRSVDPNGVSGNSLAQLRALKAISDLEARRTLQCRMRDYSHGHGNISLNEIQFASRKGRPNVWDAFFQSHESDLVKRVHAAHRTRIGSGLLGKLAIGEAKTWTLTQFSISALLEDDPAPKERVTTRASVVGLKDRKLYSIFDALLSAEPHCPLALVTHLFAQYFHHCYAERETGGKNHSSRVRECSLLLAQAKHDVFRFIAGCFNSLTGILMEMDAYRHCFDRRNRQEHQIRSALLAVVADIVLKSVYEDLFPLYIDDEKYSSRGIAFAVNLRKLRATELRLVDLREKFQLPRDLERKQSIYAASLKVLPALDLAQNMKEKRLVLVAWQLSCRCEMGAYYVINEMERRGHEFPLSIVADIVDCLRKEVAMETTFPPPRRQLIDRVFDLCQFDKDDRSAKATLWSIFSSLSGKGADDAAPVSVYTVLHSDFHHFANSEFLDDWDGEFGSDLATEGAVNSLQGNCKWINNSDANVILLGRQYSKFDSIVKTVVQRIREHGEDLEMEWIVDLFGSIAMNMARGKTTSSDEVILLLQSDYSTLFSMLDLVTRRKPNALTIFCDCLEDPLARGLGITGIDLERDERRVVVRIEGGHIFPAQIYIRCAMQALKAIRSENWNL